MRLDKKNTLKQFLLDNRYAVSMPNYKYKQFQIEFEIDNMSNLYNTILSCGLWASGSTTTILLSVPRVKIVCFLF